MVVAASEDTETDAEPSEHVEPELELEVVPQYDVAEPPAVIA